MIDAQWQQTRRILAVRLDNLGDVLVTTPALHAIKASLPYAHLTLFASPVGAQVGRLNPDIDDIIVYEAPWMDPWRKLPQDSEREQRIIATVRAQAFDGAIIFTSFRQSPLPAAYLCYLADIPLRAAASIDGPGSLLTTRHKHPERMMHEVERGLDLVSALGLTTDEVDLVLRVPESCRTELAEHLVTRGIERSRPLIVVHPGCSMPARTYPWEMYAEVVNLLVERLGAQVALTGASDEQELVERVIRRVREEHRASVHAFAGALSFPALCALIEAADMTITNNTGPMHIAAALKTPVIALFALTNPPEQWGPWRVPHRQLYHDVPCRICYSRVCPYEHECLRLISPDMVINAAIGLWRELSTQQGDSHTPVGTSPSNSSRSQELLPQEVQGDSHTPIGTSPPNSPCSQELLPQEVQGDASPLAGTPPFNSPCSQELLPQEVQGDASPLAGTSPPNSPCSQELLPQEVQGDSHAPIGTSPPNSSRSQELLPQEVQGDSHTPIGTSPPNSSRSQELLPQGVQGDSSPPAGVWGVPTQFPLFPKAAAGGMSKTVEELPQAKGST